MLRPLAALLVAVLAGPVSAATFTVTKTADTDDGQCNSDCSLREAVAAANAGPSFDTIRFAAALGGQTVTLTRGQLLVRRGRALLLDGGSLDVTVSGNDASRVLRVLEDAEVELKGLTIANGRIETDDFSDNGGGIDNRGTLTLTDCVVRDSHAGYNGGGIYSTGALSLVESTVRDNEAAIGGGGIDADTLLLLDSTVRDNRATFGDGGISSFILTLIGSTVSGNSSGFDGGGIGSGNATLVRSTVSGNSAYDFGGGIYNAGTLTLVNSTVTDNASLYSNGGGVFGGEIIASNSILAGNTENEFYDSRNTSDCLAADVTSMGYNVASTGTGCDFDGPGDKTVAPERVFTRVLRPLADNGGPTQTHALRYRTDNRALDLGGTCGPTDQRGLLAPLDGPDADATAECDAGSVEQGGEARQAAPLASATGLPEVLALGPARPNPFAARTTLHYDLPEAARVRLVVYDVLGRAVAVLVDGDVVAGRHAVVLDGGTLPSGTYLVRLEAGAVVQTQRVTLAR